MPDIATTKNPTHPYILLAPHLSGVYLVHKIRQVVILCKHAAIHTLRGIVDVIGCDRMWCAQVCSSSGDEEARFTVVDLERGACGCGRSPRSHLRSRPPRPLP